MWHFIEFDHLGLNWLTVSAVIASVITVLQYWGYYVQNKAIWKARSSLSLSLSMAAAIGAI